MPRDAAWNWEAAAGTTNLQLLLGTGRTIVGWQYEHQGVPGVPLEKDFATIASMFEMFAAKKICLFYSRLPTPRCYCGAGGSVGRRARPCLGVV